MLPRLATIDTTLCCFQYDILNNILFLNKKLYTFKITIIVLCSFSSALQETPTHIYYDCIHGKSLWERLQTKFQNDIILLSLTRQTAILGLTNEVTNIHNLLNIMFTGQEKNIYSI